MSKKSWIDRLLGRESADELIERAKAETRLEVAASMKKYRLFRAVDQKRTVKGEHVGSSVKRVAFSKLEKIYASDPVIFNGCNTLSYLVNRGWSVQGPDDAVEKELAAWLKGLKIDEAIRQIALQLCVYGNSWIENVMNKNRNRVVDIVILDPKTMDYIRETSQYSPDGSNRIKVDSSGKPVGYVQRLSGALAFRSGEKDVFFTLDEVTHLTMRKLADGFVGIGVIEPCYDESVIKVNVEEALGQAIYHIGFPVYKLRIGDKDAMPDVSDEIIDYYEKELADASSKMDFIIPWFADLTILSAPEIRDMRTNLDYYIDSQIASIGVAKPFVLGSAEGANRATLEFLTEIGDRNVQSLQKAIESGINEIIGRWAAAKGIAKESYPMFKFNALSRWDTKAHLDMIYRGVEIGLIAVTPEMRRHVAGVLNIPFAAEGEAAGPVANPGEEGDEPPGPFPDAPASPEMSLARKIAAKVLEAKE